MTDNRQRSSFRAVVALAEVLADLADEQQALDALVARLTADEWARPTASRGWSVADQVGHLAFFDHVAAAAIVDDAAFDTLVAAYRERYPADPDNATLAPGAREMSPRQLLAWWRDCRAELADATRSLTDDRRVRWFGPSMSARSFLTARIMETWAHGRDIADTLNVTIQPTDRLRHIAQIGVITRSWSYSVRGLEPPAGDLTVGLTGPNGDTWTWGSTDGSERITGPAEDFCLVVTQRRHVDDTALVCSGPAARDWMLVAQAFAGRASAGPVARSGKVKP